MAKAKLATAGAGSPKGRLAPRERIIQTQYPHLSIVHAQDRSGEEQRPETSEDVGKPPYQTSVTLASLRPARLHRVRGSLSQEVPRRRTELVRTVFTQSTFSLDRVETLSSAGGESTEEFVDGQGVVVEGGKVCRNINEESGEET
jgi:hypothetical protein